MEITIQNIEDLTPEGQASGVSDPQSLVSGSDGDASSQFRASVAGSGSDDGPDDLTGIVWAAGDHTLYLNGNPTPVHVPEESVSRTFENLQARIEAGEPPKIGLDHGDSLHEDTVPVAAELDMLTIGQGTGFDLSEDGEKIVMTDYDLTDQRAIDAAENGKFAGKDYSIVGDMRVKAKDGKPVTVESGGQERLVVTAENVRQVDVVKKGAVRIAGPGGDLPPLQTAASLAAKKPNRRATAFTASLRFAAKQTGDISMKDLTDLQGLDDADAVLEGAAEVVEAKDERIESFRTLVAAAGVDPDEVDDESLEELEAEVSAIQARADAADTLADFHDVDLQAEDGVQALLDTHTEELRADVAAKEATLAKYETGGDDGPSVDERAEQLKGNDPQTLQAMNGERANEILQSEQARDEYGKAFAAGDGTGDGVGSVGSGGSAGNTEEKDEFAASAMSAEDSREFRESGKDSAYEFMASKYDAEPDPDVYDSPTEFIVEATAEAGEQ